MVHISVHGRGVVHGSQSAVHSKQETVNRKLSSFFHRFWRSIIDVFFRPADFFWGWFFDVAHFGIVVLSFVLFSNNVDSSLRHLVSVNDLVVSGGIDSIGLASSAFGVFIFRAVILSLALLVTYLLSYSFFRGRSLQLVYRKRLPFGKFFWVNASWTIFWIVVGFVHVYALIPAFLPLVQFFYAINSFVGLFFYYSIFLFPLLVYLHFSFFLHSSFVEHRNFVGSFKGMFGSVLFLHRLIPSYILGGLLFFLLSFIIPLLLVGSPPVQWFLVLSLIVAPLLSWFRIHIFLLRKNRIAW